VGVQVAEDPAGAVGVEHGGQGADRARRAVDRDRHLAGRAAGDGQVLAGGGRVGEVPVLRRVDGLAPVGDGQVEQVRRVGGGLDERLRGGLEDRVSWVVILSSAR
jgi:hypothetical protein